MDEIFFNLKNCHGISRLQHTFYFNNDSDKNTNISLIYAPNGTMKTSFARTLKDLGNGISPRNILEDKDPKFTIRAIENGKQVDFDEDEIKKRIFVIESISDDFSFQNTGPLISNEDFRIKYNEITNEINMNKKKFLDKIKSITGISVPRGENKYSFIEKTMNSDLNNDSYRFLEYLSQIIQDIDIELTIDLDSIKYKDLFDDSILKLLNDEILLENINSFTDNLENLLSKSKIYNNENFDHNNANELFKSIKKNNLFNVGHSINFNGVRKNIRSVNELKELLSMQMDKIFKDKTLKDDFEKINNKFSNVKTKKFQQIINHHPELIPYLKNISLLKQLYWYNVLYSEKELLIDIIDEYNDKKIYLEEIRKEALKEQTNWQEIIEKFNKRFKVPYTLKLENQDDVILNGEIPKIAYYYDEKEISLKELKSIYSAGQRRALYLLDVLYKIEMLKENGETKLLIFDDIADSFDYENKYAIIEYINDLSHDSNFRLIVLTHNFDFFRTLKSRLNCKYSYFATRNQYGKIFLKNNNLESDNNIFLKLVKRINDNPKLRDILSLIPFMRNLYEYSGDDDKKELLTNILHYKSSGEHLMFNSLNEIYEDWNVNIPQRDENVYELIYSEASDILQENTTEINIVNKLILSMAIRLKSEKLMINKLEDAFNESEIINNQTRVLFNKYTEHYSNAHEIEIFERVAMMTPENIHVNSFMYEPLLDMDDYYLKDLYKDILKLEEGE